MTSVSLIKTCQITNNDISQSVLLGHRIFCLDLTKNLECKRVMTEGVHDILVERGGRTRCHLFCDPRADIPHFTTGADKPVARCSLAAITGGHPLMRLFPA